eukprot:gene5394-10783_t
MAEEEASTAIDSQLQQEVKERDDEVRKLLLQRNKAGALMKALQNPPVQSKNKDIKDANADIVNRVLSAIPDNELSSIIASLDIECCDTLMKYVYRFIDKNISCQSMLKLHSILVEKVGQGCIMRVLADRKIV